MKILELFAGSCSFSNVAKELGHETFTTDIKQFGKIDYICDIMDFEYDKVPFVPDIIWASPPCTAFSVSSIAHHWNNHIPKTAECIMGMKIVEKTISVIKHFNPKYYYIENPMGMLRTMPFMIGLDRVTVWYCRYGDKAALAFTSKKVPMNLISYSWDGYRMGSETGTKKIHPHQKPIKLYKWLLKNYAKVGDTILDTHVGSGSSRIACWEMGFDFVGYEIDKDYWEAQEKRFNIIKNQQTLF